MSQQTSALLGRMAAYLKVFLKWTALSVVTGAVCGAAGAVFHHGVDLADELFAAHGWLLYLLPVAGLALVGIYRLAGVRNDRGTNLVLASLKTGERIPARVVPLIFAGTFLTHLGGGSAGKEGAALQIGAGIADLSSRIFRLDERETRLMTMCGMSGLFSAVFATPVTAALFSLEVSAVGVLRYSALYPCMAAGLTAWAVSSFFHTAGTVMPSITLPDGTALVYLGVAALTILCALCSILFLETMHGAGKLYKRFLQNPYLRIVVGGVLVILVTLLTGTRDYNGAGMAAAVAAVGGEAVPWAFLLKILLTALTIEAGFKGGEIVPSFFIGATFGCVVGPLLGLDAGFAAAVGLIAFFCSVVNCPVASLALSVELFGGGGLAFFAMACGLSYLMSGYYTLYAEQKILYSKLDRKGE